MTDRPVPGTLLVDRVNAEAWPTPAIALAVGVLADAHFVAGEWTHDCDETFEQCHAVVAEAELRLLDALHAWKAELTGSVSLSGSVQSTADDWQPAVGQRSASVPCIVCNGNGRKTIDGRGGDCRACYGTGREKSATRNSDPFCRYPDRCSGTCMREIACND